MNRTSFISQFRRSEDGAILVFVAVALSVMMGMAAIAFDLGRVTTTQAELQSFADNVALAAAGELDGGIDSITRATNAAASMIQDSQSFGVRNKDRLLSGATDYQLFFYEFPPNIATEPAQPAQLLDPANAASGPLAAFVRVVIDTHEVETPLAAATASLVGGSRLFASVSAEAVAGFTLVACDITPMFICLPQPSLELSPGQMVKMVSQGGGSEQWGPGNFGFLASSGQTLALDTAGACASAPNGQEDSCALAASRAVSMCFSQRGVETRPGLSVGNMIAGFNTRFDRFEASAGQFQNENRYDTDNFASSPHVLDGWITQAQGNNCTSEEAPPYEVAGVIDPTATVGLPLDDCFDTLDGCPSGRIGNGTFTDGLADYLNINYGADINDATTIPHWFPTDGTRYDIYNAEVANQGALEAILSAAGKAESSHPSCQPPSSALAANPRRRVITVAGINCGLYEDELNGGSGVIPVKSFIEMFLVRPSESDGTGANAVIWGEVIQNVGSGPGGMGSGGVVHDLVQLYE